MVSGRTPLGVSPLELPRGTHVCYVYGDDEERLNVVARFLEAGVRAGDRLFYAVDTTTPEELARRLGARGVELRTDGSCMLMRAEELFRPRGTFSVDETLAGFREFVTQALADGYGGTRGAGEMSWILRDAASAHQVVEFEALVNLVFRSLPCHTGLCQYDARLFGGEMIMDALTVHPYTIVRGQVVENPYYLEPEEFLRSRAQHGASGDVTLHA